MRIRQQRATVRSVDPVAVAWTSVFASAPAVSREGGFVESRFEAADAAGRFFRLRIKLLE
ncbi:MAG: hypothetical protein JJU00_14090 [Opitutales bacterium]|nr:hypothetical protein [Opitutales bacterium]